MNNVYNRLKKVCNSGSSIGISVQSWKELEKLWMLLENLVTNCIYISIRNLNFLNGYYNYSYR